MHPIRLRRLARPDRLYPRKGSRARKNTPPVAGPFPFPYLRRWASEIADTVPHYGCSHVKRLSSLQGGRGFCRGLENTARILRVTGEQSPSRSLNSPAF